MGHDVTGLEHVGIAVADLDGALATYRALGFAPASTEDLPGGLRSHVLVRGEVAVELLESTAEGSALERFLDGHGPGLHHLCLRVASLEDSIAHVEAAGLERTGEPQEDRRGRRVFLHPRSTGGTLVGLVQPWEGEPA